jgi:hypothetical protein
VKRNWFGALGVKMLMFMNCVLMISNKYEPLNMMSFFIIMFDYFYNSKSNDEFLLKTILERQKA